MRVIFSHSEAIKKGDDSGRGEWRPACICLVLTSNSEKVFFADRSGSVVIDLFGQDKNT